jgi:hypothetical protein
MFKAMILFLLLLIFGAWFILKPGVFFVPPSTFEPEGVTLVYYEKPADTSFFSSPDTLCMAMYGEITSACREAGYNTATSLSQRLIARLPYADWAYRFFLPQK